MFAFASILEDLLKEGEKVMVVGGGGWWWLLCWCCLCCLPGFFLLVLPARWRCVSAGASACRVAVGGLAVGEGEVGGGGSRSGRRWELERHGVESGAEPHAFCPNTVFVLKSGLSRWTA